LQEFQMQCISIS